MSSELDMLTVRGFEISRQNRPEGKVKSSKTEPR